MYPEYEKEISYDAVKMPPNSLEAEQSVIGGLLLDNDRWDTISDLVTKEDFYSRAHRVIFQACNEVFDSNNPLDLITLSETLESKDQLEDCGGLAYLADLAKNTPSAANISAYADIVKEKSLMRGLLGAANDIADATYHPEGRTGQDLVDMAESKVFAIAEGGTSNDEGLAGVSGVLEKTLERIEFLYSTPQNGVTGVDTGFDELNKKTAGLQPSDLIIVAARPSMGKTTFAVNMCENVAFHDEKSDKPVLIFSLEMPAEQLMMRILASQARVDQTKIRTGQLDDEDWGRVSHAMGQIMEKENLYIDDSSGLTPTELRSRARRKAREYGGVSMIMIDYLQLMRVPALKDNRTLEIAEISRSLKALAKELKCPVVALSQLNRSLESRADKRPINSDLRESGAIEQDADLIMFLYRDEVYNEQSPLKGVAEIIIGKQRNGPIGTCRASFQGQFSRFENLNMPSFS